MSLRVDVAPSLLDWARERSRRDPEELSKRFPKLQEWRSGETQPTLKQLESYARATDTAVGLLFLLEPPDDSLPVPDFRTIGVTEIRRASPNLLDTIYLCEERQDWFRSYAQATGEGPIEFVGSLSIGTPVVEAADGMRVVLGFELSVREQFSTWGEALRGLVDHAEEAGVLVMVSGVVGSNTHRTLDPDEFRGFALADEMAPVVFINGADTRAAQIFTLAHELAHVWLGQSAVSNSRLDELRPSQQVERWCNAVAAELLVPLDSFKQRFERSVDLAGELQRLARHYKVSTLVVLRRALDAEHLTWDEYRDAFQDELARVRNIGAPGGGNFYNTQPARVSKRFARAIFSDALEGRTLRRDAFRLLGVRKDATFRELGEHLGVT